MFTVAKVSEADGDVVAELQRVGPSGSSTERFDVVWRVREFLSDERYVMNPCNGMISPPAPKTLGNHGRYRHIHLGAYVLAHHVSFPIRLMWIAHSHNV